MVNLVRRTPAREMLSLREAMDRLFEDSFISLRWFGGAAAPAGMLPLDIYETGEHVVVKATAPGVKPEDIDVTITGDLLTIKSEIQEEEKVEERNYLRQERRYGSSCRQVTLPAGLDTDQVKASFEHGVLTLELPKMEAIKPKTVKVVTR
ncbi:MAG: heat-shock protein Hsp20 [Chloroflexi bacterium HGW-Chloroflexi-1]|nr:MAG: heat-shock protein Hsp20 [Chloroflexi bacterium HGW-Chloroflexi-1]